MSGRSKRLGTSSRVDKEMSVLAVLTLRSRVGRVVAALAVAVGTTLLGLTASAQGAGALELSATADLSEVQMVDIQATGGSYRLRFGDGGPGVAETADIAFNASAAEVQAALNALTNISGDGGSVTVVKDFTNYRITFDGGPRFGTDVPELVVVAGSTPLTGRHPQRSLVRTIDVSGVHRNDERIDYQLRFTNTAPAVAGNPAVGDTLGCNGARPSKNWGPATHRPTTFTFKWLRNGVEIAGETGSSYVTTAADVGAQVQCLVTAIGVDGVLKSVLPSMTTAIVGTPPNPLPPAPASVTVAAMRPAISPTTGAAGVQRACSTAAMNWTAGGTPVTFGYKWLINGEEVDGATASTYTPTPADEGKVLQCMVTGTTGTGQAPDGGALVGTSGNSTVGTVTGAPTPPTVNAVLANGNPTIIINAVAPTVTLDLHGGEQSLLTFQTTNAETWDCVPVPASGALPARFVCTTDNVLPPGPTGPGTPGGVAFGANPTFQIAVRVTESTPTSVTTTATIAGHGATGDSTSISSFEVASAIPFGLTPGSLLTYLNDLDGAEYTQAGGHPFAAGAIASLNHKRALNGLGAGSFEQTLYDTTGPVSRIKQLVTETPRGLVGNPLAPDVLCADLQALIKPAVMATDPEECPLASAVGEVVYTANGYGSGITGQIVTRKTLFALEPERGESAQFAFGEEVTRGVYVVNARLRPEDGYAISLVSAPIAQVVPFTGLGANICSYGANVTVGTFVRFTDCKAPGDPGAFSKPLLTAPTACLDTPLKTRMLADAWELPGAFSEIETEEPAITGCESVPFTPTVSMSPTSQTADSPSGLTASIDIPSDGLEDPNGISQSHLKKTVVQLPAGVSVNPSAASGLEGCTDAQLGLKTDSEPACPDGSKLGTVEATTPVLEEALSGVMVLRTPRSIDPLSGEMLRMALIVRNDERGILVKLPGSAVADPQTGRLTATFDDNPQLPIGHVEVHLRGGSRGVLAMGQDCGTVSTKATLTPWSGNADAVSETPLGVDQRCGKGFSPGLSAGNSDDDARGSGGTYSFRFSRQDGEQWLRGLTAKLPKGLLASVKDVPLCPNGQANAGNCAAVSKIGIVDAKAGAGDPFVLEEKGEVFLTQGYKGGEYGLAVKIRPVAGPFRGEHELSPIIVRQAIHVDRETAEVTAVSDPFPTIHHGIPLRVREVTVLVNRSGFMLNPSDCSAKQTAAKLVSAEGATADLASPFGVSGCRNLAFKPRLGLRLTGRKQVRTGKHPGVRAVVRQKGVSEAGIEKAVVRLPKSLALDPDNAQALCEFEDGTKPDLENHCPKGSIVGRARAKTPLLRHDLAGNVYFVKNVRRDPKTGNAIRTLPMLIVALRGEIAINLKGTSSTTKGGKLVNTFASVPDAPISRFNLNIKGGRNGILTVTRTRRARINLCARPKGHVAEADMDGHNGRRYDRDVRMKTPCGKRSNKDKAERRAAGKRKAAAKRRARAEAGGR